MSFNQDFQTMQLVVTGKQALNASLHSNGCFFTPTYIHGKKIYTQVETQACACL